jgi:hypothetical protein
MPPCCSPFFTYSCLDSCEVIPVIRSFCNHAQPLSRNHYYRMSPHLKSNQYLRVRQETHASIETLNTLDTSSQTLSPIPHLELRPRKGPHVDKNQPNSVRCPTALSTHTASASVLTPSLHGAATVLVSTDVTLAHARATGGATVLVATGQNVTVVSRVMVRT